MPSMICYSGFGFWTSNGLCESIYDYLLAKSARDDPESNKKLTGADEAEGLYVCWRVTGLCPQLEDTVRVLGDERILLDLLDVDEELLDEVTDNPTWRANLTEDLLVTAQLLRGDTAGERFQRDLKR